jgi:hypothetical protein
MRRKLKNTSMRIYYRILLVFAGIILLYTISIGLACIPGLLLLPEDKTTTVGGITTLEDAVRSCCKSGLDGWDLVEYAQKLTAQKFTYSRRNSWESPEKAFARGQGYCVQQTLALKKIFDELGIPATAVHGKGEFPESVIHGIREPGGNFNHSWLEVTLDNESRFVCPGNVENTPGKMDFKITSKVKKYTEFMHFFTFSGAILVNAFRDFRHTQFRK